MDPVFGFTTFVRFSWSTVKNILEEKAIEFEWEEEEDEDESKAQIKTKTISNYFSPRTTKPNKRAKINSFFKERNLKNLDNFDELKANK